MKKKKIFIVNLIACLLSCIFYRIDAELFILSIVSNTLINLFLNAVCLQNNSFSFVYFLLWHTFRILIIMIYVTCIFVYFKVDIIIIMSIRWIWPEGLTDDSSTSFDLCAYLKTSLWKFQLISSVAFYKESLHIFFLIAHLKAVAWCHKYQRPRETKMF